jgi:PAS domain-containing protein
MTAPQVDYSALYRQLPVPVLALTPEFLIADANEAYMEAMGRRQEDLLGRDAFDAFPDNPSDRGDGHAQLDRVAAPGPGHRPA